MKDALLIQVSSETQYAKHLGLTYNRHLAYCLQHDFDYQVHIGSVRYCDHPAWAKFHLASQAFTLGYEYVVYLDDDAFIADLNVDLRTACLAAFNLALWSVPLKHLQCGVIYMNNGNGYAKGLLDVLIQEQKYYLERFPDLRGWYEQGQLNDYSKMPYNTRHFHQLPLKWNYNAQLCGSLPSGETPAVLAWHGIAEPQRTEEMLCALSGAETFAPEETQPATFAPLPLISEESLTKLQVAAANLKIDRSSEGGYIIPLPVETFNIPQPPTNPKLDEVKTLFQPMVYAPAVLLPSDINGYYSPTDPGEIGSTSRVAGYPGRLSINDEEAAVLAVLAYGRSVLEIGTGLAVSTRALASTAWYVVTCDIDPWVKQAIVPQLPEGVRFVEDYNTIGGTFDMVFIDGLHTEEQCTKDIAFARKHLTADGIIVFHDLYIDGVFAAINNSGLHFVHLQTTAGMAIAWASKDGQPPFRLEDSPTSSASPILHSDQPVPSSQSQTFV
jgi:hypothetical protein